MEIKVLSEHTAFAKGAILMVKKTKETCNDIIARASVEKKVNILDGMGDICVCLDTAERGIVWVLYGDYEIVEKEPILAV